MDPLNIPISQRDVEQWLIDQQERLAEQTRTELERIIVGSYELFLSTLTASGDLSAFDGIVPEWELYVDDLMDELGRIYLSAGIRVWTIAPTTGQLSERILNQWVEVVNRQAVDYAAARRVNIVSGVGENLFTKIKDLVTDSIAKGTSNDTLRAEIMRITEFSKVRADMVARTETAAAFNNGDWESMQALGEFGPVRKYWIPSLSGKFRPWHLAMADSPSIPVDEPFDVDGEPMMFPQAPDASAYNCVNCVVEGEVALPVGNLDSISRAWWPGPTIQLVTADGNTLRVTPNHPIFTDRGLVAAQFLKVGDNVVSVRLPVDQPYNKNGIPTVDELYRSCRVTNGSMIGRVRGMNFHGDIVDGEVEIVWPDSLLQDRVESVQSADGVYLVGEGQRTRALSSFGYVDEPLSDSGWQVISEETGRFVVGNDASRSCASNLIGFGNDVASLVRGAVSESDQVGFASVTNGQTEILEASDNDVAVNSEMFSHRFDASSGVVERDDFVLVEHDSLPVDVGESFSHAEGSQFGDESGTAAIEHGHHLFGAESVSVGFEELVGVNVSLSVGHWVYNLSSSSGVLWSPGIAHSNCRCVAGYLFPNDVDPVTGELVLEDGSLASEGL